MSNQYPNAGLPESFAASVPGYLDRLNQMSVFEAQALFRPEDRSLEINGTPERIRAMLVTPSVFRVWRLPPQAGRAFTDIDAEPGNDQVAIISHGLWQQLYPNGSSPIGAELRISGLPHTIVGVMPRDFVFFDPDIRVWIPRLIAPLERSDNQRHAVTDVHVGRLKSDATMEQAQSQVDALNLADLDRFPQFRSFLTNAGFRTRVWRFSDVLTYEVRNGLYLLWGGAAFVLLIGVINIANDDCSCKKATKGVRNKSCIGRSLEPVGRATNR